MINEFKYTGANSQMIGKFSKKNSSFTYTYIQFMNVEWQYNHLLKLLLIQWGQKTLELIS